MQVSGVEVAHQTGGEKSPAKPSTPASGLFEALLQGASGQSASLARLESGTGLAQQIVANETQLSNPDDAYASEAESRPLVSDRDDADAVASEEEQPEEATHDTEPAHTSSQTATAPPAEILATSEPTIAAVSAPATSVSAPATSVSGPTTSETVNTTETAAATEPAAEVAATAVPAAKATAATATATATQAPTGNQSAVQATVQTAQANAPTVTPEQAVASNVPNTPTTEKQSGPTRLSANVTDTSQQLVSRPANTLAAVAAVTAQASRQQTNTNTASSASGGEPRVENGGNLLLNGTPARAANTNGPAQTNTPQTAANAPPAGAAGTAPSTDAQPAPVAPLLPAQQTAATANRPASPLLRGGEPIALDATNGTTGTGSTASTATARVAAPPTRPTIPPRALTEQIAVQVQKSIAQGQDRIKIQLKPAELGRVEIRLDVMQDGRVAATVVAERPETLELLQRDARGLQQALQDAGLKSDSASLSFNLGGGNASDGQQSAGDGGDGSQSAEDAEALAENDGASEQRRASDSLIDVEV